MKKTIHTHLSKTCELSRLSVVLNFPQSIDPQVSVRKWPTGEFTLKVMEDGAQTNLCLHTPDKTEVLASFKTEADARAALDELYGKLLNRRVRTFFKWVGYAFAGLVAWTTVLFAYGIFVTFGPSAAQSARASMESSVAEGQTSAVAEGTSATAGFQQFHLPGETQQASTPTPPQLAAQALADVQAQTQANGAQQGQTQPQSYGGDVNEAFAAAKK